MMSNEMISYVFWDDFVLIVWFFLFVDFYMFYYFSLEVVEFFLELFGYKGDYIVFINFVVYIEFLKKLFLELLDVNYWLLNGMFEIVEVIVIFVRNYGVKLYVGRLVVLIEKKEEKFIVRIENVIVFV